jgi:acyl-CoA oxidase
VSTPHEQHRGAGSRRWEKAGIDPAILPFAPMIYVAWADGVLGAGELDAIRARVAAHAWPDGRARDAVERWLDPGDPPAAVELEGLLSLIRARSSRLPVDERRTLARLGLALAAVDGDVEEAWSSLDTLHALQQIEEALGVLGAEAARDLLTPHPPPAAAPLPRRRADSALLREWLEGERLAVRTEVLAALVTPAFRRPVHLPPAEQRAVVFDWLRELTHLGFGAAAFPREFGGRGDIVRAITIFETLAFHDLSLLVKFGVHFGLAGGSILFLGTRPQHERWLPGIASLELPGCFAMTETAHGSNVREIETTATWDPKRGEFVVHTPRPEARKDYIGNAALHGRLAVVFAQLRVGADEHGVHALLVPIRDAGGAVLPGIAIEDCGVKAGLNGVDNGRISFRHVRVPRDRLLDRFGSVTADGVYESPIPSAARRFFTMLGALVAGRISIAAAAVSAAKSGLTIAVRYTSRRRQFGPAGEAEVPVLDYLAMQRRLLPALATTYACDLALRDLVGRFGSALAAGGPGQEIESLAAGIKAYAAEHAVTALQACREACGGAGYMAENRLGALRADTDIFTTFEGANDVLLQLVARGLLTEYREQFGELRVWSVVRYLGRRAATAAAALNPIASRRTDPEHLRDPGFHRAAFRYREERLLGSAARRLKQRIDGGMDSFQALNETQHHLLVLARASVERVVLERMVEAVAACDDERLQPLLLRLSALYALARIEADAGWFQETGYLEGVKARAVRRQVDELCRELRPHALTLVAAFGIPDEVLAAPIGTDDVA